MIVFVSTKLLAVFQNFLVCQVSMKNLPYTIISILKTFLMKPVISNSEKLLLFIPHFEIFVVEIAAFWTTNAYSFMIIASHIYAGKVSSTLAKEINSVLANYRAVSLHSTAPELTAYSNISVSANHHLRIPNEFSAFQHFCIAFLPLSCRISLLK